ncbi:hypothetical protein RFI_22835 [Reticulomyxa filosa]|uniref:Uncharacterized protein n=1 Tax=Reticulomyxa filosa TaxID=46433 RepID=X6MM69_RETFI|nr:hypothetical protein RFI_22835 [Reticulomyxa filosa]|eukprot:ETO14532.1 hypothetical protein RFI_22835 [Reticulomyxa filosa]
MSSNKRDEDEDSEVRKEWGIGSQVEVYSASLKQWVAGDITRIFLDGEGEWLEVQYSIGKCKSTKKAYTHTNFFVLYKTKQKKGREMRLKQIPRSDTNSIRPCYQQQEETKTQSNGLKRRDWEGDEEKAISTKEMSINAIQKATLRKVTSELDLDDVESDAQVDSNYIFTAPINFLFFDKK